MIKDVKSLKTWTEWMGNYMVIVKK